MEAVTLLGWGLFAKEAHRVPRGLQTSESSGQSHKVGAYQGYDAATCRLDAPLDWPFWDGLAFLWALAVASVSRRAVHVAHVHQGGVREGLLNEGTGALGWLQGGLVDVQVRRGRGRLYVEGRQSGAACVVVWVLQWVLQLGAGIPLLYPLFCY